MKTATGVFEIKRFVTSDPGNTNEYDDAPPIALEFNGDKENFI